MSVECEWDDCERDFETEQYMKIHHAQTHGESIEGVLKECDNCAEQTRVAKDNARRNEHHFCDKQCHGEWLSENQKGEDHPNFDSVEVECAFCNHSFLRERNQANRSEKFFCDHQCRAAWLSVDMRGEGNHNYKGGLADRGQNWEEMAEEARERDFYQCRACPTSNKECVEEYGCQLHVHHKIPIRKFDTPEDGNYLQNLITLCPSCHQTREQRAVPSPRGATA